MAFYLLTYFNDVNVGKKIWINSHEQRQEKMKQNWERQKKHGKRKQRWWKWLQWNEIANLNSLKPFEFEPKTNIEDMNSIRSDDEEEGAEYKVKRQVTLSGVSLVQRQPLANFLQNRCQACNLIKKGLQHRCFPMKFTKFLSKPFFTEHLYSGGCFWK